MLPKDTLAAVATEPGATELQRVPVPELDAQSGLLEIELTGVCGSDWGYYQNLPRTLGPLILGHESVGRILSAGAEAQKKWKLKEGDRVALEEYIPCGACTHCRSGYYRLCRQTDWRTGGLRYGSSALSRGQGLWGGYAQHQFLHSNTVFHKVPDHVSARHAALALPLSNGIEWAILQGGARIGDVVLVQGPGQQGLCCVAAAKAAGASLIIVSGMSTESDQKRLALAKRLGADVTIDIEQEDLIETVAEVTSGEMASLVIDCASGGPASVVSAIAAARKMGRVLLAGQKRQPIPAFNSDQIIANYLTVRGMRGHSFEAVEVAMDLIATNHNNIHELSTHQFALHEVDLALHSLVGKPDLGTIHATINPWR